jgi:hypothetical protein
MIQEGFEGAITEMHFGDLKSGPYDDLKLRRDPNRPKFEIPWPAVEFPKPEPVTRTSYEPPRSISRRDVKADIENVIRDFQDNPDKWEEMRPIFTDMRWGRSGIKSDPVGAGFRANYPFWKDDDFGYVIYRLDGAWPVAKPDEPYAMLEMRRRRMLSL